MFINGTPTLLDHVNINVHCSCKKRFQPFCVSVMWCHWNYLYSRRSLIGLQTCQLSRCSRESPSFSSNISVSRLEHKISRREPSEDLRVIFGEYSGIVKNDILNVPIVDICIYVCIYVPLLGSLRSYDGNCNESVTLKLNFALSLLRLFHVGHVVHNKRSALSLAWREWFSCKGKE